MKNKIIIIIAIIGSLLFLSACNNDEDVLKVGMDLRYPPFETTEDDLKTPTGISVDIAKGLGEHIGKEVEIVNMDFTLIIPALETGEIDIAIASMSIKEDRKEKVDFTDPYFYFKIVSLVNKDFADANGITPESTVEDLVELNKTTKIKAAGVIGQVSTSIPEQLGFNVTNVTNQVAGVTSVIQGDTDILLHSANPIYGAHKANKSTTIVLSDPFESSPIAMATKKGNTELLTQANEFIDTFFNEGGMYDQLRQEYDAIIKEDLDETTNGMDFYIYE